MKKKSKFDYICVSISTLGFIGYAPKIPGTIGTLAAFLLYIGLKGDYLWTGIVITMSMLAGMLTIKRTEKVLGVKDPRNIVIDEFAGMFVGLYLLPFNIFYAITGFLLFRIFDIFKPFGIRRLEKISGGIGVIADDILAGIYTNLLLHLIHYLNFTLDTIPQV